MGSKSKYKSILLGFLFTSALPLFAIDYKNEIQGDGLPIINSMDEKDILPGGFRMSRVVTLPKNDLPNLNGLDTLNISGSSQFSEHGLDAIIKRIGKKHITLVNLRQEDGGFIEPKDGKGAIAFSYLMSMPWWTGENPKGNRTLQEIEESEDKKMAGILNGRTFTVYGTGDSYAPTDAHTILYKIDIVAKRAFTEKTLAEEKGLGYFRLPDKKFGNMQYEHVDEFIEFVKNLPEGEWLHFHCKKGQSRTTLFMTMYDMMKNADIASADDIIKRQGPQGLGGADLMKLPDPKEWDYSFKKQWLEFLYQFHAYILENKASNFEKSWSTWAEEQKIVPAPPVILDDYYRSPTAKSLLPENEKIYKGKTLVLNMLNETKLSLSNFRSSQDLWLDENVPFNSAGLKDFQASGSNQYSKAGLKLFLNKVKEHTPNVVVVDLRHDDHLFVNDLNVSTFETKEALLKPRSPEEIKKSEIAIKNDLQKEKALQLHAIDTKYPKNVFDNRFTLLLKPEKVETPEEVVTSFGAEYLLIGSKRFSEASDEDVDRFISFYKSKPKDTWYHFHCKKGKSRTTFFLVIYDMMQNADKLSMTEIVERQKAIGGIDLFDITPKDPTWGDEKESKKQWIQFLTRFYEYCKENKEGGFATSWAEWSKENADFTPNVDHLVYDRNITVPGIDLQYSLQS